MNGWMDGWMDGCCVVKGSRHPRRDSTGSRHHTRQSAIIVVNEAKAHWSLVANPLGMGCQKAGDIISHDALQRWAAGHQQQQSTQWSANDVFYTPL